MDFIIENLNHLYISPLEQCNLHCKMCYTQKTIERLSAEQILDFIKRYQQEQELEIITFCGGEVFLLNYFVDLVNQLSNQGIFVQIITNGTIDCLADFAQPNLVNLIVSLDGLPADHDANRGQGNFAKSLAFLQKAQNLGFHTEVFCVLSQRNFNSLNKFEKYLIDNLAKKVEITYHPRKPRQYLSQHPVSNQAGQVKGFEFLTDEQIQKLASKKQIFPPKNLGCYQVSLMSDGEIYGCCEGINPLGNLQTSVKDLINNLKKRVQIPAGFCQKTCLGCVEQGFVCGFKEIFQDKENEK